MILIAWMCATYHCHGPCDCLRPATSLPLIQLVCGLVCQSLRFGDQPFPDERSDEGVEAVLDLFTIMELLSVPSKQAALLLMPLLPQLPLALPKLMALALPVLLLRLLRLLLMRVPLL